MEQGSGSSNWSDGQIELFHALGRICERVGREGAEELLREGDNTGNAGKGNKAGLGSLDGRGFVAELKELRRKAGRVGGLEVVCLRLTREVDGLREALAGRTSTMGGRVESGAGAGAAVTDNRSLGTQTESDPLGQGAVDYWKASHERLLQKHDAVVAGYQELVDARAQLERKLRKTQKLNRAWVKYAKALEKEKKRREERREGLVSSGTTSSKRRSGGRSFEGEQPALPLSSRELASVETGDTNFDALSRRLPNMQHVSERIPELAGSTAVRTPGYESLHLLRPTSSDLSELQTENSDDNDIPQPLSRNSIRLNLSLGTADEETPTHLPKLWKGVAPHQHHEPAHPSLSDAHSGTTEENDDILPDLFNKEQINAPGPVIKAEPSSESPVIISSCAVKKRKSRKIAGLIEPASDTRIKVEEVTSSPTGLAGFQPLFPEESLDLDEIGEKMNTPKKRRQATQNAQFGNNTAIHDRSLAELDQTDELLQNRSSARPQGNPSALQPVSPNKQVMPRTLYGGEGSKRRRLGDRIRGAVILGEDGESDGFSKIDSDAEIQTENNRKLPAKTSEFQRRLTGLLEEPSPRKELITPGRASVLSGAAAHLRAKVTPADKHERTTPSSLQRQFGAGRTPNTAAISRPTLQSDYLPSTSKKHMTRTPRGINTPGNHDTNQEPLRARPVHSLVLSDFKVNPHSNAGADYAFSSVVRGRDSRKCLPGCTKPECCGTKFRKFVEFARTHEAQPPTASQQETDTRLLEEFLGDSRARLKHMGADEREEVLLQARTRDLANRAGKHRHAFERRRSPPGFWRSDFPDTQEAERDRVEARAREKELVERRWEEAMRPGGRWLFRDE